LSVPKERRIPMTTCTIIPECDLTSYQEFGGLQEGIDTFKDWVAARNQTKNPSRHQIIDQDLRKFSDQLVLDGANRQKLNQIAGWSD